MKVPLLERLAARIPRTALASVTLGAFLILDLCFKILVVPSLQGVLNLDVLDIAVLRAVAIVTLVWILAVLALVHPIDRAMRGIGATDDNELVPAIRMVASLPTRLAVTWSIQWFALLWVVAIIDEATPSIAAFELFGFALVLGPAPLAHGVACWITNPTLHTLLGLAQARGLTLPVPRTSLRSQLAGYSACLCLAPSAFMASIAFTARDQGMSDERLVALVGVSSVAVTTYAVLCSLVLAEVIAIPIRRIGDLVQNIAQLGEGTRIGRVPVLSRDEIGLVAEGANLMLDRLERTATERERAWASLEELAHSLEARVDERTLSLTAANEAMAKLVAERESIDRELFQAQKLTAIGQLAAGIAHEINTPMQYIGDNTRFAQKGVEALRATFDTVRELFEGDNISREVRRSRFEAVVKTNKVSYLLEELPLALEQSIEGIRRVSNIVIAMKDFSHPSAGQKAETDLAHCIDTTVEIARNRWKYVADLEVEHDPSLPRVPCLRDEMNQVLLNLIINAADAIADVTEQGTLRRGHIRITTKALADAVEIRVTDDGGGIPVDVQARVFEPFFTSKPVGQGTGQGLSIARSVVHDKHGGRIWFETQPGVGTTFVVSLPLGTSASELS